MNRIRPDVDIVNDVLKAVLEAQPASEFVQSLYRQYHERGGLSKKQLQGLYGKASRVSSIPSGKLATLEAIILRKPTKYKSALPPAGEPELKDERPAELLKRILEKYPLHKRALFLKATYDKKGILSAAELSELEKFAKLLT